MLLFLLRAQAPKLFRIVFARAYAHSMATRSLQMAETVKVAGKGARRLKTDQLLFAIRKDRPKYIRAGKLLKAHEEIKKARNPLNEM